MSQEAKETAIIEAAPQALQLSAEGIQVVKRGIILRYLEAVPAQLADEQNA